MPDPTTKGTFQTDIPADAVEEAVRSVERIEGEKQAASPAPPAEVAAEPSAEEPGSSEGENLAAQLELSQKLARETLERLKETHDRYIRAVADLENYKKRAQKERDEVVRYGNEKLLKDLFPVLDGLDRALSAAAPDDPLVQGVQLVRAGLEQVLARHGVTSFSALGQPFDPSLHEALLQVPSSEHEPGTVVVEHARGFLLNDRLARPAMVGVAKAPEPAPESEPRGDGEREEGGQG